MRINERLKQKSKCANATLIVSNNSPRILMAEKNERAQKRKNKKEQKKESRAHKRESTKIKTTQK